MIRPRLHLRDLRVADAEPDTPMSHHRVELVQLLEPRQQLALAPELRSVAIQRLQQGDLHHQLLALGEELVERRIDHADGDRLTAHRLEDAVEVLPLQG